MQNDFDNLIGDLNQSLIKQHSGDKALFGELTEIQKELGLLFGDRPTCPFLRPHFLPQSLYRSICKAAETIAGAAERLTEAALLDSDLLERLDLTEDEKRLVLVDPGYTPVSATSRFDSFIGGDSFKFLEYNAETPAGVGDQMQLEKVLRRIPLIREFLDEHTHWLPRPHQKLLQTLVRCYRETGGRNPKPNIAIVDWDGVSTESEFFILKDYFESMGFRTLIANPEELEYDGSGLRADSFEIDVVYKRLLIQELLEKSSLEHPIVQAYDDGNLCLVNSFRVKIPHKKSAFAIFTDPEHSHLFTAEQLAEIDAHIPWTRIVEDGATTYAGSRIELLSFIRESRERFILKPNDDYGGKGIVLGWETDDSEWDSAIEEAMKERFIVQERAEIRLEDFPYFDDDVSLESLLVDFDPFLFCNQTEGGMVRLSSSALVNVTQGGGQTALAVLEGF